MDQPPAPRPYQPGPGGWPPPGAPQPFIPHPPPSPPSGRGRLWIGVAIGAVIAVLIGAALVLTGVAHFGDDTPDVDTATVTLPATLGDLRDQADVVAEKSPKNAQYQRDRNERGYRLTAERYQQAFGGAGIGVRTYSDNDLQFFLTVIAVRSDSPGLVNGVVPDLSDLQVAAQPGLLTLAKFGDVDCLQTVQKVVKEGAQISPEDVITTQCRRAGAALTIYLQGSGAAGAEATDLMVATTNAAFEAVAGS